MELIARRLFVMSLAAAVLAAPLVASSGADYQKGLTDGRLAAQGKGGEGFWYGFGGGCCGGGCIGGCAPVSTPLLVLPLSLGGGALGGAGAIAIGVKGGTPPSVAMAKLPEESENYRLGYLEGYSSELKNRRRSSAITGAVVGTGAAAVFWLAIAFLVLPNIELPY